MSNDNEVIILIIQYMWFNDWFKYIRIIEYLILYNIDDYKITGNWNILT